MKKIKYLLIILLTGLSFLYTKQISELIIKKSFLANKINSYKADYDVNYIDASIDNDYIIPGLYGKSINVVKTYYNIKEKGVFNEEYFIYDEIAPKISLINNKDKIINKGNSNKKEITLLLTNKNHINYAIKNNIIYEESLNSFYKIVPTYTFYNESIINYYVSAGDIIKVDENVTIDILNWLIKEIKYQNLSIVNISELISEKY